MYINSQHTRYEAAVPTKISGGLQHTVSKATMPTEKSNSAHNKHILYGAA